MTRTDVSVAISDSQVHPGRGVSARLRGWWRAITATFGALLGLAPHVLHHVGLLAGTAVLAGTGGTVLFGALGFAASIPMLLRLHRRFASWWAPTIGLAVFIAAFSLSAFVVGPAITDSGGSGRGGGSPTQVDQHYQHHHGG